jgi:hypothetical protein
MKHGVTVAVASILLMNKKKILQPYMHLITNKIFMLSIIEVSQII